MINRYFYRTTLSDFINSSVDAIFGCISRNDEGDSVAEQKFAWSEEIEVMQNVLRPWKEDNGEIIFEYSIPRLGKRIDVVLLLRGLVFVIEFKAGQNTYMQADMEQVLDYALDLKNFHLDSHNGKDSHWVNSICKGFIDLMFVREGDDGEYYSILDWKSDVMDDADYSDKEALSKKIEEDYSIQRVLYSYSFC